MSSLIEHLESHLGPIQGGWKDLDGKTLAFRLLRFEGGPIGNTVTYTTLGLSDTPLSGTRMDIRHELVFMCRQRNADNIVPAILHQLGMEARESKRAYLRGDVLGPRGTMLEGTSMEAIYVAAPVYLADEFAVYRPQGSPPRVFAWLVPITRDEAEFVRQRGWSSFEELLIATDPDLLNMNRKSVV